jgi:hypothetical protein
MTLPIAWAETSAIADAIRYAEGEHRRPLPSGGLKMRSIWLGALTALVITTAGAAGEYETVNVMLPYCKLTAKEIAANTSNALKYGRCTGTVDTISQMFAILREAQEDGAIRLDNNKLFCTAIP